LLGDESFIGAYQLMVLFLETLLYYKIGD